MNYINMKKAIMLAYVNMPINTYIDEIRMPVLLVHGSEAHSRYFSEDAFKKLTGDNKDIYIGIFRK